MGGLCLWYCGFCAVGLTSRFEVYKLDILTSWRRSQAWVIMQFSRIFLLQEFGIFDLGLVGSEKKWCLCRGFGGTLWVCWVVVGCLPIFKK